MCLSRLKPHQFYPRHGIFEWNQEGYKLYINSNYSYSYIFEEKQLLCNARLNRLILYYFEISYGIEQYYCMNLYDKINY